MPIASDDDLLTPTLGEEDDVCGYQRPWNPWSLVVLSFFTGVLGAGWLLASNFRRLGMQTQVQPLLGLVIASSILLSAMHGLLGARGFAGLTGKDAESMAGLIARVLGTVLAVTIGERQRERYRLFSMTGEQGGGLFLAGLAAGATSLLIDAILRSFFLRAF